jgi:hypothetical protein
MKFHYVVFATFGIALASPAQADNNRANLRAHITQDTLEIGPEINYQITPRIGLRAEFSFLTIDSDTIAEKMPYSDKIKLRSGSVLADVFPFKSGFRISGGLRFFRNKTSAVAKPIFSAAYSINGKAYSASQIGLLTANPNLTSIAPVVSFGYATRYSNRFVFGIEAGALFRGSARANPMTVTGLCASAAAPAFCSIMSADLEAERQGLSRDISRSRIYPLVQLKMGYRF